MRPIRRTLLHDYKLLTPAERSLWRYPMMWLSAVTIALVPLLYATIYLGSSIDPYGNLGELPVGLVNLDAGTLARGQTVNVGRDTINSLNTGARFHYLSYPSEATAREAVQRGQTHFALIIPRDFSRRAVGGDSAQHGLLNVYVSEGGSYFASRIAGTFATNLGDTLNKTLSTQRWAVVQTSLAKVQRGFSDIRQATGQLQSGAAQLEDGAGSLNSGAGKLSSGLQQAASGSARLSSGAGTLSGGVGRLTGGSAQLGSALRQLEAAAPGQVQLAPLSSGAA